MRFILLFVFAVLIFGACKNEPTNAGSDLLTTIATLEKDLAKGYSDEKMNALREQYAAYTAAHPDDRTAQSKFVLNEAGFLYSKKQYRQAINLLEGQIQDPTTENRGDLALLLGSVYKEGLQDSLVATLFYKSFLEGFPAHGKVEAISKDYGMLPTFDSLLYTLGENIYSPDLKKMDFKKGKAFWSGARNHTFLVPQDPRSPEYLVKAAEVARSIGAYDLSLTTYQEAIDRYPDAPKSAVALFMQGFILDEDLNKDNEAKSKLTSFITKYPDHKLRQSAEILIENLGKTDEELIEAFQKKGK